MERNRSISNFANFNIKVFESLNPSTPYLHNWHIDLINNALNLIEQGKIKRLIINMPPRALKSLTINVAWPSFILGKYPEKRIISASHSQALSEKHSLDSRNIMHFNWFKENFSNCTISNSMNQKRKFMTTKNGFRMATSIGSALIGEGGDYLIIDDPLSPLQSLSKKFRIRATTWFEQTFITRLNNKKLGAIIIVMQRLHEEDLSGYLIAKRQGWHCLTLPSLGNDQKQASLSGFQLARTDEENLNQLIDDQHTIANTRKELGEATFLAQYQQQPLPCKGNIIKKEYLTKLNIFPSSFDTIFQSWDTAIKTNENNSYSVCITFGIHNGKFYILDVLRSKKEYIDLLHLIKIQYEKFQPSLILIEDKASGQILLQELKNSSLPITSVRPTLDKEARLYSTLSLFETQRVFLPTNASWLGEYEEELLNFPNSQYNDQVDATTQGLNFYLSNYNTRKIKTL